MVSVPSLVSACSGVRTDRVPDLLDKVTELEEYEKGRVRGASRDPLLDQKEPGLPDLFLNVQFCLTLYHLK
ncbi:MAG: hypothetical protein ACTSRC_16215 [Candidatus Helarchaeota archaeon]